MIESMRTLKILFHISEDQNSKTKGCVLLRGVQQPISWLTENQLAAILIILINCCANVQTTETCFSNLNI